MTAPRAFTTLLTEAIKKLAPKPARASQWAERLAIPRGYSRQEFDTFLAPELQQRAAAGNPQLTPDDLVKILEERGAVSKLRPANGAAWNGTTDPSIYEDMQRMDLRPGANYREKLPYLEVGSPVIPGPHRFPGRRPGDILPSWARMEDVKVGDQREPMVAQLQSDRRRLGHRARSVQKGKVLDAVQESDIKDYYSPEAWDASSGDANYRPAIAMAIRDALDSGHSRLLFPTGESLEATGAMLRAEGDQMLKGAYDEVDRVVRGAGVEPEWENVTAQRAVPRSIDYRGPDIFDYIDDYSTKDLKATLDDPDLDIAGRRLIEEHLHLRSWLRSVPETERNRWADAGGSEDLVRRVAIELGFGDESYIGKSILAEAEEVPVNVRALKLDQLKGKALPILSAAIMAGAGAAALPGTAEAQEATPPDDPRTDSLIAAIRRGAGMTETAPEGEDEGGANWGLLAGTTAAIAAAALGGPALRRALTRSGPSAPPIPSRGLVRQLTTHAPITHPTTPAQAQAIAAAQAERQVAVSRLRSLVDPIDPNDEHVTRTVDQALANGPSYARQMRPVDGQIADIQESLVRHGLVKTSGTVHDVDLVRTAKELVAKAGNEEFWLKDPERVLSSPEQLAAAIAAQDNGAAMVAAIQRSLDPTLSFEEQQFAARVADEFMQRMIGAQQRVTRDISETGRTLRATQLLGDIFAKNGNNGQAWVAAATRIAGTDLQAADASAIVRLAVSGQYSAAAKKLNMLRTAHPLDKLDEGLRSAMQLTFFRPFRDLISNLTNVADFATAGRIASIADLGLSVFSGQREVMPPGLLTQLKVLGQGFKTGGTDALRLLMRQNVDGDMEFMRRVAERMDFTNETTFTHPVTHFLATQARRWFSAADYPAYRMAFNDALADMSMVAAYKAGHRGNALGPAAMDLFEHPGPALTIKAQQEAVERVWQSRNFVSTATNSFMANASPATRFMARRVMPFVHTASTQIGQALNQSPVGYFKTAADLGKFVWSSIKRDPQGDAQRQLARRLGLHATGLGWLSLGYYLADNGRIQGTFDSDARARDAQEEQNQRPMTIEVNGKWYAASILLGPQAMLMAMGAGLHQGLKNMAEQEAADPEMEQRWLQSAWAVARPMGTEALGVTADLPLADGFQNLNKFAQDFRGSTGGQAMGGLAGRIATQPIPAFVQQYAETQDLDADGDVVRRDTRGSTFSEAFSNTVREAVPGQRQNVPVRATPLGKDGKGVHVGDSPLTSLVNPLRNQYDEQEDWVVQALIDHDAFPAHQGRHEGESQADYNRRRMAEGDEEYEALANAMDGKWEFGLEFADQNLLKKWASEGAPIPSPNYTALLRSVSAGLRRARTTERNKLEKAQASRP